MIAAFAAADINPLKWGVILFFVALAVIVLANFFRALIKEPKTLGKLLLVTAAPITLAALVGSVLTGDFFGFPLWVSCVIGLVVYALTHGFLEKRVDARFEDER